MISLQLLGLGSALATATAATTQAGVFTLPLSGSYEYDPSQGGSQYFDGGYYFNVTAGTPPQNFRLIADTGSPDTWIQGAPLGSASPIYRPSASSTFHNLSKPWIFEYGGPDIIFSTNVTGYAARDTLSLSGLTLTNETFAVGTKSYHQPDEFSQGFVGLTYSEDASSLDVPGVVCEAIQRNLLAQPLFGVRLTRAQDAKTTPPSSGLRTGAGNITLGGVDTTQFKQPITYAPVQQHKGFWQIAIDGFYVNGQLVASSKGYPAAVDTGTSIIVAPPTLAKDFFAHLGGTPSGPIAYTLPCNTTIDVAVGIGGQRFPIKAQDMNGGFANANQTSCYANVYGANATNANSNGTYPSNNTDVIILGLPLLLNTYTVFDYSNGGRVGFASLVNDGPLPFVAPLDVAAVNTTKTQSAKAVQANEIWAPRKKIGILRR